MWLCLKSTGIALGHSQNHLAVAGGYVVDAEEPKGCARSLAGAGRSPGRAVSAD